MTTTIRAATDADWPAILAMLHPVFAAGETYAVDRDLDEAGIHSFWMMPGHEVFVAEIDGKVVGTYYLMANRHGGGAHVANCGYVTSESARGKGVASAMCTHSLTRARERGFRAMQFNHVVSTNEGAVALWQKLGFTIVGTLPGAFEHPVHGFVDAYVMFRAL
ncbi:MAG: GNAT family N-acetyltransferase [Devosia sp. 63-57]|nr:MAG: GNAT family N-acetyltransferase [Pelagibacterium sp. SCN 63-126]ODU86272.1 MAG: GNAT family N-acetyltransferase [Pelagibacterium sp. SCN 63-17]OJX45214.1 MAG: GNAT family N-acetyltransferase [Devosia sp. 63-57]